MIMLGALVLSFSELPAIVTGQSQASWPTFLGGLVVGLPATIYFYSRQNRDSNFRSAQQIELEFYCEKGFVLLYGQTFDKNKQTMYDESITIKK